MGSGGHMSSPMADCRCRRSAHRPARLELPQRARRVLQQHQGPVSLARNSPNPTPRTHQRRRHSLRRRHRTRTQRWRPSGPGNRPRRDLGGPGRPGRMVGSTARLRRPVGAQLHRGDFDSPSVRPERSGRPGAHVNADRPHATDLGRAAIERDSGGAGDNAGLGHSEPGALRSRTPLTCHDRGRRNRRGAHFERRRDIRQTSAKALSGLGGNQSR